MITTRTDARSTDEVYLCYKTNSLKSRSQDLEIKRLEEEVDKMKNEKINKTRDLIAYFYKR